jgi:hypothetical protein
LWQLSQEAVVVIWRAPLPGALLPLWQESQLPSTAVWSTLRTGLQRWPSWQLWQALLLGIWSTGLTALAAIRGWVWQLAHWRGVPRKIPELWQLSQGTERCGPLSGKPVMK